MPNQRDPDKRKIGFWLTADEKKAVEADMKKLGIETYTEYILLKLGVERDEDNKGGDK